MGRRTGSDAGGQAWTHPPSRVKVAFRQGFVIISIRIREGPLSHDDAGSKPAEQGRERPQQEPKIGAGRRAQRPAPWQPLPCERRPTRSGPARAQNGCRSSESLGRKGARFSPTSAGQTHSETAPTRLLRCLSRLADPQQQKWRIHRPLPVGSTNQSTRRCGGPPLAFC